MSKPDGGPSAPVPPGTSEFGMTMRDSFAQAAMQGLLASGVALSPDVIAAKSYAQSDAMLTEKAKP